MKKETSENLFYELKNHAYGTLSEYNIERLFYIYTETEIQEFSDLFKESIQKDFNAFVNGNAHLMRGLARNNDGKILNEEIISIRSSAYLKTHPLKMLTSPYFSEQKKDQERFVELIEHILCKQKAKILDVGSGEIPYSSFLLAKDNVGDITSMDKFSMSNKSIERLGVHPRKQYFKESTPITNFDMIVANRACSAIPHIVANCVKDKKPYLLRLCPCEAPNHEIDGWKDFLPTLDEKIKFDDDDYAFNLDL